MPSAALVREEATQYSGTVAEGSGTTVSFQVGGTITSLPIEEGQHVRWGQLLAAIDGTTYREQYNAPGTTSPRPTSTLG
jgi:multidrug efflux pump subunit AcrA (membrane-fusion protein)